MDLTKYYQQIREMRESLTEKDVVVMSRQTQDGGKPGVLSEVPREVAAKMMVDGIVTLASGETAEEFRRKRAEAKEQADREIEASKIPMTVISTSEFKRLRTIRSRD